MVAGFSWEGERTRRTSREAGGGGGGLLLPGGSQRVLDQAWSQSRGGWGKRTRSLLWAQPLGWAAWPSGCDHGCQLGGRPGRCAWTPLDVFVAVLWFPPVKILSPRCSTAQHQNFCMTTLLSICDCSSSSSNIHTCVCLDISLFKNHHCVCGTKKW